MLPILSNSDLQSHFSNAAFVLKTQRQIIKDFGTAGIDFPETFFSSPIALNQLMSEISIRLKTLNSTSSNSFSQLLYQIDLPESILPDLAQSENFYIELAELVLKREAYKVFLRSTFL